MKVNFITPTRLSLIDITSMGDSSKRNDTSTIGQFDSGLKYAIALLLRSEVELNIRVHTKDEYTELITFGTFISKCESSKKEKELIHVNHDKVFSDGEIVMSYIETGFAKALGYNWELWMALRELYSNMLDENGGFSEGDYISEETGTVITLEFDDNNAFFDIWENKHLYINQEEPLFKISNDVDVLDNPENYLRIYKQNILVYSNEKKPSRFAYNIKFGEIDERRILSNLYSVESNLIYHIKNTANEEFLRSIIIPKFDYSNKEFLNDITSYGTSSDLINSIANDVFTTHGSVNSYAWLMKSIRLRNDCVISGKIINTIKDSMNSYTTEVLIQSIPEAFSEPNIIVDEVEYISKFSSDIKRLYNFDLDVEVKIATLAGSRVVADKFNKCLIIDDTFSIDSDMSEFIVQYIDLTMPGNVIRNMGEYICKLLKK